jgi:hypothetical protein
MEKHPIHTHTSIESNKIRCREKNGQNSRENQLVASEVQDDQRERRNARENSCYPSICILVVFTTDEVEKMTGNSSSGCNRAWFREILHFYHND